MRRGLAVLLLALQAFSAVAAASLDQIVVQAKVSSDVYRNLIGAAKGQDFDALLSLYDRQDAFAASLDSTWSPSSLSGDSILTLNPSLSYRSASDDVTSVEFSSPISISYASEDGSGNEYNPTLSFAQRIAVDGVHDRTRDLAKEKLRIQADSLMRKADAQFEASLCTALSQILQKESDWHVKKASCGEIRLEFESSASAGLVEEGSYSYKSGLARLLESEALASQAESDLNAALKSFERISGFAFEGLDDIDPGDLEFELLEGGNSDVQVARLDMLAAENEYDMLLHNDDRVLNLNALADLTVSGRALSWWGVEGSIGYEDSNWNAKIGAGADFDARKGASYPKVTLSLSYSAGPGQSDVSRLERQKALIERESERYGYETKLFEYRQSAQEMTASIGRAKEEARSRRMDYENAASEFENDVALFEDGYYSDAQFESKKAAFKKAENDYKSYLLSLVILRLNARILNC